MKRPFAHGPILRILLSFFFVVALQIAASAEIPSVISFQGRLSDTNGVLLTGTYNVTIRLYGAQTGGSALWTEAHTSVPVVSGIHNIYMGTVTPLTSLAFDTEYWASVEVNSGGEMSPRRRITTSPYAFRAKYADTATRADTATWATYVTNAAPDTDWTTATGETIYHLRGNVGIGTASPGESLTVAGTFKGGVSNTLSGILGFIGGGKQNSFRVDVSMGVISGGESNYLDANYAAVLGGYGNRAQGSYSTVTGGMNNRGVDAYSTISGGESNLIGYGGGQLGTIGGGFGNLVDGGGATIAGGRENHSKGAEATIGGGYLNQATGNYSTIPGGALNQANGKYSFAAGFQADAQHDSTFVWSDGDSFVSTAAGQFLISARGGVGIETNAPVSALAVSGTVTATAFVGDGSRLTNVAASIQSTDLRFPDGTSGTLKALSVTSSSGYTVPAGMVLYVISASNSGVASGQSLQIDDTDVFFFPLERPSSSTFQGVPSVSLSSPLVVGAGRKLDYSASTAYVTGLEIATSITPVIYKITSSVAYVVPSGKTLVVNTVNNHNTGSGGYLRIGGTNYFYVPKSQESTSTELGVASFSFATPLMLPSGTSIDWSDVTGVVITGYLK